MTPAEQIVRRGVVHIPEGRKIFAPMTVRENLEMGAYTRTDPAEIQQTMERALRQLPTPQGAPQPARWNALRR